MEYTKEYLAFWEVYPKRANDSKSSGFKAWQKIKDKDIASIMKAVEKYKSYTEVRNGYNKGASVWLNQRMWETINEAKEVTFETINVESTANEQTRKVMHNVINPLIKFYGEPNFYEKGRDVTHIINKWVGALSHFSITAIQKGLEQLVTTRMTNYFPSLPEVLNAINQFKYIDQVHRIIDENKHEGICKEASDWYEENFLRLDEPGSINMSARYKALGDCFEMVRNVNTSMHYNFTQLIEEAWMHGFIQSNFDKLYKRYDEELLGSKRYQVGRNLVKKLFLALKNRIRS
jgi:hypothetical protein